MRCAIYTRKSVDERADREYSSLDNQHAYCAAYVASQGGSGWEALPHRYDDGGYSGGTLDRPALTQLRADLAKGGIDMVVVYKIDRLSRSLRDFANLVAEFEAHGVAFVSVTQSFDTSTSMGRLMLNVLLSFAQFERELTGERLRDWFAGARARGLWTHPRPYGYLVVDGRLSPHPDESKGVEQAYRLYRHHGSARIVANLLNAQGLANRHGRPWSKRTVTNLLANPLYSGRHPHPGAPETAAHPAIVSHKAWQQMQDLIARQGRRRQATRQPVRDAMLKGILFGPTGHAMIHVVQRSRGNSYRYYVSTLIGRYGRGASPQGRFRAGELEAVVVELLERLTGTAGLREHLRQRIPSETEAQAAERVEAELCGLVRRIVQRIDIKDEIEVTLISGGVFRLPLAGQIAETARTHNWWRAPSVVSAVSSALPAAEIGRRLGITTDQARRIRHRARKAGLLDAP